MSALADCPIERNAAIETWFGAGGGAEALARPESIEQLRALLERAAEDEQRVRVLGDGANLLIDDEGVDGLIVSLEQFKSVERVEQNECGAPLRVGAGVMLQRLVSNTVRDGLGGLEGLGGVPATLGGAVVMNAGGAFGQIADRVERIHAVDLNGETIERTREEIDFGYRRSGLGGLIVTAVDLRLGRDDPTALRERLKDVMARKKQSQPMAERSCGCVFKNPMVDGRRRSAGELIEQAGCKGMRVGGAEVSSRHGNFFVTRRDARARDVIELIETVRRRVEEKTGVRLEEEVVIWRRDG